MAYRIEKGTNDLVISGWEKGIAPSPHSGLGDSKCLNIGSMPGEVQINYARVQQSQLPITSGTFTASGVDNVVVYTGTKPLIKGTWVTIAGGSTITNLDTSHGFASGANYYIKSYDSGSGNTTLSIAWEGSIINNFGLTGTATFSTVNMGKPIAFTYTNLAGPVTFPSYNYFVLDNKGLVWLQSSGNITWQLLQPTSAVSGDTSPSIITGVFCFASFLFVAGDYLYYKSLGSLASNWTKWTSPSPNSGVLNASASNIPHSSVLTPSGLLVLCDGSQLDTLMAIGSFDPTNAATYTWQYGAVLLPGSDIANTIAMIGNGSAATGGTGGATNVVVGGLGNQIYPWAPGTAFFQPVIFVSESYIQQMVTVNNLVYIFAGSKGNIYITNGSSLTSVISVPDYIANSTGANQDPYFIWGGAMYLRGRIWFSAQAPNCGGVWSFIPTINYYAEQDTGISLRLEHQNSYGTYAGLATILFAPQKTTDQQAEGVQYWAGWDDGTSGGSANPYGIDFSGTTPYTNGAAIIETDLIPTGTYLKKDTLKQIEYKLSAPLVAGESIAINYRTDIKSAWQSAGTLEIQTDQSLSGLYKVNFEKTQWLQLQIILTSTVSSPSYVRLTEVRVR